MQGKQGNAMDPQTYESAAKIPTHGVKLDQSNPATRHPMELTSPSGCRKINFGFEPSLSRIMASKRSPLRATYAATAKIWKVRSSEHSSLMGLGSVEGGVERYGGG